MANKTYEFIDEIFAVGKWNGYTFSVKDLEQIAETFNKLEDVHQVPLKFGHNDEQPLTDGQPALGWVEKVWVDKDKQPAVLMARYVDVPEIVYKAMKQKRYRNRSIELDFNVQHKGSKYKYVLSGVALLGADIPAVNVLSDLDKYIASRNRGDNSLEFPCEKLTFSVNNQEDSNMDELDKLKKQIADLEKEKLESSRKLFAAESKADQLEKAEKDRLEKQKADAIKMKRADVTEILEKAVKDERITPAQREMFSKLLNIQDDEAVMKVDFATVKQLIESEEGMNFSTRKQAKETDDEDETETASEALTNKTYEYMEKHGEQDFSKAMFSVMRANPKLANKYKNENGEKRT
jgi:hypothetical protein